MSMAPKFTWIGLVSLLLLGATVGCRRGSEPEEAKIDWPALDQTERDADPPKINFPSECQQSDKVVNEFIDRVLNACNRGDYDRFCQLLGTSEAPPSQENFKRIWHGVSEIAVKSVHSSGGDSPEYFLHAIAKLRQPDTQKRVERQVVIRICKEMGQWRIGGAPKEIIHKVLVADTQPSSAPSGGEIRHKRATSTAPATRPSVYKNKHRGS